jgi:hypothetical protein
MVELVRRRIGYLASMLLGLLAALTHNPQDDDAHDDDSVTSLHEGQRAEIAPPPPPPPREFEPMHQEGWPWSAETDTSWQHVVRQMVQRQNNFLIVTNGARRQAMNEFEIATA